MRVGTKSLLWGGHQFLLHPLFVALAWRLIYKEWPKKIPIWVSFFLHDIGYWGLERMQDEAGECHPERGARLLSALFDWNDWTSVEEWYVFSATHSRFYAKKIDRYGCSDLMRADKYATCLVPLPLYLLMVYASGEVWEYTRFHQEYEGQKPTGDRKPTWREVWWWCTDLRRQWRENYGPGATAEA